MIRAGQKSLDWIEEFITTHGIDCHFARNGRFHAAHTQSHFDELVAEAHRLGVEENVPTIVVPRQDQHQELGTDAYFGGIVFTQHASLHPAKYYAGILRTAIDAGVRVTGNCPAIAIERSGIHFIGFDTPAKSKLVKLLSQRTAIVVV